MFSIKELNHSQRQFAKLLQNQILCKEIEMLKKKENISKTKRTYELGPYVDSDGLLRLSGRL